MRLRHIARVNPPTPAFSRLADEDELTFLPMEAVWPGEWRRLGGIKKKSDVATGYTRFQDGDVLVPKITPTFEASRSVLARGLHGGLGAGTTELHVVRCGERVDPRYLLYTTHARHFLEWGEAEMYGVAGQQRVPDAFLKDFVVRLPDLAEQRRVADFLDAETARIDRLAALRRRWAGLVEERWSAELHNRIDAAGPRRIQLRRLLRKTPQYGAQYPGEPGPKEWPRYIRITDLTKEGDLKEDGAVRLRPDLASQFMLEGGDVLVARSGATVGKAFLFDPEMGESCFAGYLIRLSPNRDAVLPEYLELWMRTGDYWAQIESSNVQATIQNVSAERYKELLVPVPPVEEQQRIVAATRRPRSTNRVLQKKVEHQLALLAERRQALITAAVTGQIDVTTARGADLP